MATSMQVCCGTVLLHSLIGLPRTSWMFWSSEHARRALILLSSVESVRPPLPASAGRAEAARVAAAGGKVQGDLEDIDEEAVYSRASSRCNKRQRGDPPSQHVVSPSDCQLDPGVVYYRRGSVLCAHASRR